ncbi:MAG: TlpA disulfide reductase family protein, partial [Bacteroidota bacterium]
MANFLIRLFALTLIFLGIAAWIPYQAHPPFSPPENDKIPLQRLGGNIENLCDYQGKVILIHFWASYCRPCVSEFESLHKLYQEFDNDKFEILAVSVDADQQDIHDFNSKHEIKFPIFHDPRIEAYTKLVGHRQVSLPYTLLRDKKGKEIGQI